MPPYRAELFGTTYREAAACTTYRETPTRPSYRETTHCPTYSMSHVSGIDACPFIAVLIIVCSVPPIGGIYVWCFLLTMQ